MSRLLEQNSLVLKYFSRHLIKYRSDSVLVLFIIVFDLEFISS